MHDECIFMLLFVNPGLTNLLWGGTDLPNPPLTPGGKCNPQPKSHNPFRYALGDRVASFGVRADEATLACLDRLAYFGRQISFFF